MGSGGNRKREREGGLGGRRGMQGRDEEESEGREGDGEKYGEMEGGRKHGERTCVRDGKERQKVNTLGSDAH